MSLVLARLLEAWRDAERRLGDLAPDHPDRATAEEQVDRARAAYQAASDAATQEATQRMSMPEPRTVDYPVGRG